MAPTCDRSDCQGELPMGHLTRPDNVLCDLLQKFPGPQLGGLMQEAGDCALESHGVGEDYWRSSKATLHADGNVANLQDAWINVREEADFPAENDRMKELLGPIMDDIDCSYDFPSYRHGWAGGRDFFAGPMPFTEVPCSGHGDTSAWPDGFYYDTLETAMGKTNSGSSSQSTAQASNVTSAAASKSQKKPDKAPARQRATEFGKGATCITTLMMYDIPFSLTVSQVVDVMNAHGFWGTYDFVYMPPSKGRSRNDSNNIGYAFMNFKHPGYADAFSRTFQNYQFAGQDTRKLACTKPAKCQGYQANLKVHAKHAKSGCLYVF